MPMCEKNETKHLKKKMVTRKEIQLFWDKYKESKYSIILGKYEFSKESKSTASAVIYSLPETVKLNYLLPWSTEFPKGCRKPRR